MDVCKPCKVYEWYLRKLELHLLFTGNNERVQHIRMIWSLSKIVYIITTSVNYLSVSNSPFSKWKWKSLSCIRLFVTPWTIQFMEFSRSEYWSRYPFPSPWDFPNPGIEPRSPACKQVLYQLSLQGNPRILDWVAYLFSSGSSRPRNRAKVSCIAGRFFTRWAASETPYSKGGSNSPPLESWASLSNFWLRKGNGSNIPRVSLKKSDSFCLVSWYSLLGLNISSQKQTHAVRSPIHKEVAYVGWSGHQHSWDSCQKATCGLPSWMSSQVKPLEDSVRFPAIIRINFMRELRWELLSSTYRI